MVSDNNDKAFYYYARIAAIGGPAPGRAGGLARRANRVTSR